MGNKCSACSCTAKDKQTYLNCFGNSKKSKRKKTKLSADVLPEDLHASSRQECVVGTNISIRSRPNSLEVQAVTHGEPSSKFPAFPLHGIQKSSPTTACGNDSPVGNSSLDKVNLRKIEKLFESYRDSSSDEVLAEGVERFCLDLEVDPMEFIVLALAWKFKAETMCKFTRKEFCEGFVNLCCDSIPSLRSAFKQIEADAIENFKDLYRYTFQFALDADQGQRSLPCNIAIAMWNVVFSLNPPLLLDPWLTFLQKSNVRGISRDTWNMFLYLTESLGEDLSNYNDNEAWPSLFDDFVDHQREVIKEKEETKDVEKDFIASPSVMTDEKTDEPSPSLQSDPSKEIFSTADDAADSTEVRKPGIPGTISSSTESSIGEVVDRNEIIENGEHADEKNTKEDEDPNKELLHHLHADADLATLRS